MKTITVGFSCHKGFAPGSKIIKLILNRPFSHTYFKFKEDLLEDFTVFHAIGRGLSYVSYTNFKEHNNVVAEFDIEITDELYIELLNDCQKHASIQYGYMQNLGIVLVRGLSRLSITIKRNPFTKGINCSEWVYYILEEIYGNWIDSDPNLVGPDQVFDFLTTDNKV